MGSAGAFSPGHITGIFQICDGLADPLHKGSRGAGVSIEHGVKTKVTLVQARQNSVEIRVNGQETAKAEVSETVTEAFLSQIEKKMSVKVEHEVGIPVGSGFGSSGAAALSLALALNKALELGLTKIEAAQIAHSAEISCKTGLGTVLAETFGGVEIRTEPGAPGIGEVHQIAFNDDPTVASLIFGALSTSNALANESLRRNINKWGGKLLDSLTEEPNVENFLRFSKSFAEHTGMITPRVRRVLEDTTNNSIASSMPMFGEGVFSIVEDDQLEKLLKIYRKHGSSSRILLSKIDLQGARLL
jgi:pantoate kinase